MPTARNARGIDVVAYDKSGEKFVGIQVKALSRRHPVPLGTSLDKIMDDYWIIVNDLAGEPTAFVMLPEEVKSLAHRGEKDGRVSYWHMTQKNTRKHGHELDLDTMRHNKGNGVRRYVAKKV